MWIKGWAHLTAVGPHNYKLLGLNPKITYHISNPDIFLLVGIPKMPTYR